MSLRALTRGLGLVLRGGALVPMLLAFNANAHAASTSLSMQSDPGDYIGGGQDQLYTLADGEFTAQRNAYNGVSLAFHTPTYSHWWYVDFAAADSELLFPGAYPNAVRFPFQPPGQPGLSIVGDGRGCNTVTGSFQVLEVEYGAGSDVMAFRATFEQHCEGGPAALRGEIRFNASVPVDISAPTAVSVIEGQTLTFEVAAVEIQGRPVALSASGLPPGASFVDHGDNTGTFAWAPAAGQAGTYTVAFHGDNQQGDTATVFTVITAVPPPPANDELEGATHVSGVPFTLTEDTVGATVAPDDPFCSGRSATVWFAFTAPASMRYEADTFGSGYDTTLSVYTGSRGFLWQLGCNDNADGTLQSRVRFNATAGQTYYIMASAYGFSGAGGPLSFHLNEGPPPLSIAPSVFRYGRVSLTTGLAEVSGSVTCSQPTYVSLYGQLRQEHAGRVLSGYFGTFVPCNGTTSWTATVNVWSGGLFHGRAAALLVAGPATVSGTAYAFDPETGEYVLRDFMSDVVLRGSR
jgi:putative Ig domain-containing protein